MASTLKNDVTTSIQNGIKAMHSKLSSPMAKGVVAGGNVTIITLLNETLGKLKDRHAQMMKELRALRSAVSQAKTDQKAVAAVRAVNDLTTGVESMHLGGALDRAKQESAVAREELKQAVGSIQDSPEVLLQKSKAQQRIAEMRAKL
jgi:hypothetical protein